MVLVLHDKVQEKRKTSKKSSMNIALEAKLAYFNPIRAKNFSRTSTLFFGETIGCLYWPKKARCDILPF